MIEEDMTDELIPKVLTHVDKEEIVNGTYTIPDYIQIIGNHAFKNQNKLEKIIISDSVTEIGKYAFEDCQNLREVIMSKNIKKIDENAFENCYSLRYLVIPNSIEQIVEDAFYHCENLNLTIKTSLFKLCFLYYATNAGFNSFEVWWKFKTLTIYNTTFSEKDKINKENLDSIRKRELTQILTDMLIKQKIPFRNLYKDFPDAESFIDSIVTKFDDMDETYDYHKDLQNYIDDYLSKHSIVQKVFEMPTIFGNKTREQIYNFIATYTPENIVNPNLDSIMQFSKLLEDYPTYISGEFLKALSTKTKFNKEIKQIIKYLNNMSKMINYQSILNGFFFRKENENNNKLSLNIENLNKVILFANKELEKLTSEIELFEFLKEIITIYIIKRKEQIKKLNEAVVEYQDNEDLIIDSSNCLTYNATINSEIAKLNKSIELITGQYQNISTLLSLDIVNRNELTSLLKDVLPNLITQIVGSDSIQQKKEIINDIKTIKDILNSMIIGQKRPTIASDDKRIELKLQVDQMIGEQKANKL